MILNTPPLLFSNSVAMNSMLQETHELETKKAQFWMMYFHLYSQSFHKCDHNFSFWDLLLFSPFPSTKLVLSISSPGSEAQNIWFGWYSQIAKPVDLRRQPSDLVPWLITYFQRYLVLNTSWSKSFCRTGKRAYYVPTYLFWNFTETKRFDFFKISQLFWGAFVLYSLKILSFWS